MDMQRQALAERWVLEYVVETRYPVDWFGVATDSEFKRLTNGELAGLQVDELREALVRLASAGMVEVGNSTASGWHAVPSLDEPALRAAITGSSPLTFGLTPLGGNRWESLAHPDWGRYVRARYARSLGGEVIAQDRDLAESWIRWHQFYPPGFVAVPGSLVAGEIVPWQATYWKNLPCGWRITFQYEWVSDRSEPIPEASAYFARIHNWYASPFKRAKEILA